MKKDEQESEWVEFSSESWDDTFRCFIKDGELLTKSEYFLEAEKLHQSWIQSTYSSEDDEFAIALLQNELLDTDLIQKRLVDISGETNTPTLADLIFLNNLLKTDFLENID